VTPRDAGLKMKLIDYRHVDVMVNGKVLHEGRMIPKDDAVLLLQGFAKKFGPVIVETEQLNQLVERDVVHPDGTVEPYYNVAGATKDVETLLNTSLIDALGRAVATGVVEDQPQQQQQKKSANSAMVTAMDYMDVEGELRKLASSNAGSSKSKTNRPADSSGSIFSKIPWWGYVALAGAGAVALIFGL